jgi:hypothetical protein
VVVPLGRDWGWTQATIRRQWLQIVFLTKIMKATITMAMAMMMAMTMMQNLGA